LDIINQDKYFTGPASSIYSSNAQILDRKREARMGKRINETSMVATGIYFLFIIFDNYH
jgi:hypothetical protein